MIDLLLKENLTVDDVLLVPKFGELRSRSDAELHPFIYSAPMDTVTGYDLAVALNRAGHIPVVSRALENEWLTSVVEAHEGKLIFLAMGPGDDSMRMLEATAHNVPGAKLAVAIDIAHGHSVVGKELVQKHRELPQVVEIMSGSVCTAEAAIDCIEWGCTHLRIGVGPGSLCTTRRMCGVGFPQLSAVHRIYEAIKPYRPKYPVTLIADGGIRYPGDAVAYLAAGADAIMLGREFSRCEESAGWVEEPVYRDAVSTTSGGVEMAMRFKTGTKRVKRYRGQASHSFQMDNGKSGQFVEGETGPEITPQGTVQDVVNRYEAGVRSALSYLGLTSIHDLKPENVEFIRQTTSGYIEGSPHGLDSSRG